MIRRWAVLRRAAMLGLLCLHCAVAAQPPNEADCPPQAQAPTPGQLQAAREAAQDRGVLWRISKDGRSSYLYGTIHVGKLEWAFPGPQVRNAMLASDLVAFEIDPLDPAVQGELQRAAPAAPARLPAALAARLATQRERACVPPQALATTHPLLQAVMLSVLAARRVGLEVLFGQEMALSGLAHAAPRAVASLETPAGQMAALIPHDPAAAEHALSRLLDQLERGSVERSIERMAAAWERGDLATLEAYDRWCECSATDEDRDLMRRINDGRNPAMAERIAAIHHEGRKVFAAVGALHMTGAQALPALMQRRGFRVERVSLQ